MGVVPVARKKNMEEAAIISVNAESVTVEGLEEFFVDTPDQPRTILESTPDQGWTLSEAAEAHNVTERTIRRWIKEQVLSAWKVEGPRGPEWRINPGSSVDKSSVQAGSTVDLEPVVVHEDNKWSEELDRLWELLKEKDSKIEALTMRTGYLQHQVESQQDQLKLLTDSQHKAGWWQRFKSWVQGR